MASYISPDGAIVVIRYPVYRSPAAMDVPLPPISIQRSDTSTSAIQETLTYIVYEPYVCTFTPSIPMPDHLM